MKTLFDLLDEKIPRDVVSLRDGGGGRKLSYLEGWYVIDRLNKTFGHTGWSKEITDVRQIENVTSKGAYPAYLVKMRLTVQSPENGQTVVKEGYGYGSDKSSLNAHELAIKEAVTDALKVAAKDLGMSMGLALYDKSQENVDDGEENSGTVATDHTKKNATQEHVEKTAGPTKTAADAEKIRAYIQSATKIALKKGVTIDTIKSKLLGEYGVNSLADAADDQLPKIKSYIDSLI